MRVLLICLLLGGLCLGCNRAEKARLKAAEDNLRPIGEAPQDLDIEGSQVSETSHVIASDSKYYTTGPQQGRPPDGEFPAGTKVDIVEDAGSYVLVRSDGGIEAYVAADAVRQQDNVATDVAGVVKGGNQERNANR